MSEITVVYIDDDITSIREVNTFAPNDVRDILSGDTRIHVELIPTGTFEDILQRVRRYNADVYLVDLDLSQVQVDSSTSAFKGTTIADALRDRYQDTPIVLFTRQSVLDDLSPQRRRQILDKDQLFDAIILKDEIYDRDVEIRDELIALVQGFRVLNDKTPKNETTLYSLIGLHPKEDPNLSEAALPLGGENEKTWISTEVNKWIRHTLAEFSGLLYDELHASTKLGISVDAFLDSRVQEILKPAQYGGDFPLPKHKKRWWKVRLLEVIKDFIFDQDELEDPFEASFNEAFYVKYGVKLEPAICIWDCEPTADWVCYVLKQPVKLRNTLRYFPSEIQPKVMDEPRVSFRAIWESEDFNPVFLDAKGKELVRKIQEMDDPCA